MFHVEHFGPIGAKNLTRSKTVASLSICKIDRFFGAIGIGCPSASMVMPVVGARLRGKIRSYQDWQWCGQRLMPHQVTIGEVKDEATCTGILRDENP